MTAVVNQNLNLNHLPVDEPVATQGPFGPFARISKMQIREKQEDSTDKLVFNYDRGLDLIEIPVDFLKEACRFLLDSSKCKEAEGKGEMVSLTVPSFKSSFRLHAKIYSCGSLYGIHIDDDASDSPKVCDGWTLKDRRRSKRKRDDGDDAPVSPKKQKLSSGDEASDDASDEVSKEELTMAKNHLSALIGKTDPTDDDIKEFQAQNNKMKEALMASAAVLRNFAEGLDDLPPNINGLNLAIRLPDTEIKQGLEFVVTECGKAGTVFGDLKVRSSVETPEEVIALMKRVRQEGTVVRGEVQFNEEGKMRYISENALVSFGESEPLFPLGYCIEQIRNCD